MIDSTKFSDNHVAYMGRVTFYSAVYATVCVCVCVLCVLCVCVLCVCYVCVVCACTCVCVYVCVSVCLLVHYLYAHIIRTRHYLCLV